MAASGGRLRLLLILTIALLLGANLVAMRSRNHGSGVHVHTAPRAPDRPPASSRKSDETHLEEPMETTTEPPGRLADFPRIAVEKEARSWYRTQSHGAPGGKEFGIFVHDPKVDIWTSGDIARDGTWQPPTTDRLVREVERLRRTTHPYPTTIRFLDMGANLGFMSMWVASVDDKVEVISVEPHPRHADNFERSLRLKENKHISSRITLHRVALSDETEGGKLLCMKVDPKNAARTFVDVGQANDIKDFGMVLPCSYVPVTTLDKILLSSGSGGLFPRIDIIKIDIEGFEPFAFMGGSETVFSATAMSFERPWDAPQKNRLPSLVVAEITPYFFRDILPTCSRWLDFASGSGMPKWAKPTKDGIDYRVFLLWMMRRGYGKIEEMFTEKFTNSEEEMANFFHLDNFMKEVPSGHTDVAFYLTPPPA